MDIVAVIKKKAIKMKLKRLLAWSFLPSARSFMNSGIIFVLSRLIKNPESNPIVPIEKKKRSVSVELPKKKAVKIVA